MTEMVKIKELEIIAETTKIFEEKKCGTTNHGLYFVGKLIHT